MLCLFDIYVAWFGGIPTWICVAKIDSNRSSRVSEKIYINQSANYEHYVYRILLNTSVWLFFSASF